jgi:hypothetical protein
LRRGRRNQTLQPTKLVNETWLRLIDQSQTPLMSQPHAQNTVLARDLYLASIENNSEYAPVGAQLGRSYRFLEKFGSETATQAGAAQAALERPFALNPDLGIAHHWYGTGAGLYLDALALASMGRGQEAAALLWTRKDRF